MFSFSLYYWRFLNISSEYFRPRRALIKDSKYWLIFKFPSLWKLLGVDVPVIVVIKFLESFIKTLHLLIGQPVEDVLWAKKSPLITIMIELSFGVVLCFEEYWRYWYSCSSPSSHSLWQSCPFFCFSYPLVRLENWIWKKNIFAHFNWMFFPQQSSLKLIFKIVHPIVWTLFKVAWIKNNRIKM